MNAMLALTWKDIALTHKKWKVRGRSALVPESLRPCLRRWRKADGGEGPLLRGVSSNTAPEPAFLVRRVSEFFLRAGLDGLTLASIRGRAGENTRLAAVLEQSRPVTAQSLTQELGVSRKRAEAMMAALEQSVSLPPDNRARFAAVLTAHRGETVTTALLRQETGFATGLLQYYIKEALKTGRLQKEKHGVYRCL